MMVGLVLSAPIEKTDTSLGKMTYHYNDKTANPLDQKGIITHVETKAMLREYQSLPSSHTPTFYEIYSRFV